LSVVTDRPLWWWSRSGSAPVSPCVPGSYNLARQANGTATEGCGLCEFTTVRSDMALDVPDGIIRWTPRWSSPVVAYHAVERGGPRRVTARVLAPDHRHRRLSRPQGRRVEQVIVVEPAPDAGAVAAVGRIS